MFEGIDFSKMGEMLSKAQEQASQIEQEAKNKSFCAKSGGGMVNVCINGAGEVFELELDDSLLEDKESLQILLISAINDAIKMVEDDKKLTASQMLSSFGGFGNQN